MTSGGSASGHTAILARTMGIPAVIGIGDALRPEHEGREVIVDGATGQVVLDADPLIRDAMLKKRAEQMALKEQLDGLKGKENVTKDGQAVKIFCNIGSPGDVSAVKVNDGGGVGLFRSEFLYLASEDYPTEDQLFQAYQEALSAMGLRALRICLTRPEVFRTQLRALYRASVHGKLGIMFPMVASVWEFQECRRACLAVQEELRAEGVPFAPDVELGVMIETPAAVLSDLGELAADLELTGLFLAMGIDELSVTPNMVLPLRNARGITRSH